MGAQAFRSEDHRTQMSMKSTKTIHSEVQTPVCMAQFVLEEWDEPFEHNYEFAWHFLQLSLLPQQRSPVARFPLLWGPNRYAPIGDVFFFPAGHAVDFNAAIPRQQSVTCSFDPAMAERYIEAQICSSERRFLAALDIANPAVRWLLVQIGKELREPGFASDIMVEMLACQLLIEVSRYLRDIDGSRESGGLSPWRLRLIDERLNDGDGQPTLSELADLCDLSVRHLTRAFRVSCGRTIGDHIGQHRMKQAKRLLLSGLPVKEVSEKMDFSAPNNFSSAFRRITGETPREFTARVQSKNVEML